jgi:hypothetical protein
MAPEYACVRCGFCSPRLSSYKAHLARKKLCSPVLSEELPSLSNMRKVPKGGAPNTAEHVPTPAAPATTIYNTTNNIVILSVPSSSLRDMHFPRQDLSHLSDQFKRRVVDIAKSAGFEAAVQAMFEETYFNVAHPHNMNVLMENTTSDDGSTTTHVRHRDRVWRRHRTDDAVRQMLEEQGDAIRNFPDELCPTHSVPEDVVKTIDDAYESGDYLDDPQLFGALEQHGLCARALLDRYSSVMGKLAEIQAYSRRSSLAAA